jgi:phospholipase C
VLTLATPRTDDPLAGIVVPQSGVVAPNADEISHLQQIHAELVADLPVPDAEGGMHHTMPVLSTRAEAEDYIRTRTEAWKASRRGS